MFVKIKRDGWKERVIECNSYSLERKEDPNGGDDFVVVQCDPDTDHTTAYTFDVGKGTVFVMNEDGKTIDKFPRKVNHG